MHCTKYVKQPHRVSMTISSRLYRHDGSPDSENDSENGANVLEEEIIEAQDFRQNFPQAFGKHHFFHLLQSCVDA